MKLFDVIALIEDIPKANLRRGQVGTVVEELAPNVYEVEFSNTNGVTYAMLAVHTDQMMVLHHELAEAS